MKNNEIARDTGAPQATKKAESVFIRLEEAAEIMSCSRSTAQRCFTEINAKLRARGCFTIAGRCNRKEFYKAIGLDPQGL